MELVTQKKKPFEIGTQSNHIDVSWMIAIESLSSSLLSFY
jgi:hypothetical protein